MNSKISTLFQISALLLVPQLAKAVELSYDLRAGNRAPAISGNPDGVTVSNFSVGVLPATGGTDGVPRVKGSDVGSASGTAITNNQYFSFSVTIPVGKFVNLTSLSLAYQTNFPSAVFSNARVFSLIDGYDDLVGDTIGVVGKAATETPGNTVTTDTLNLTDPTGNPTKGANVQAGDFDGLTARTVTFFLPWIDGSTSAADYTDIRSVTLSFDLVTPVEEVPLRITDFTVAAGQPATIHFTGTSGQAYSLMASVDLTMPLYRKRWSMVQGGTFGAGEVSVQDADAPLHPRRFYVVSGSTIPRARILCLGDSITEGNTNMVVYKGPLYDKLTAAEYRFEYVGSKTSSYTSPSSGTVSLKHEGYSGQNCTQIAALFATNSPLHPADIVIIHSAHNLNIAEAVLDAAAEAAIVTTVENATRAMIQTARTTNPAVKILLAKVITSGKLPKYSYIPAVNLRLGEIAAELTTAAQPVISVDQAAGFDWTTDTITDKVHPNAAGGQKMAQKFFDALVPLLE